MKKISSYLLMLKTNGKQYSDRYYVFQDSRVAADNKNNRWHKSMPEIKMVAMNRKYIYNTCIFSCMRNSNEIPTAIPMFSRSGNYS